MRRPKVRALLFALALALVAGVGWLIWRQPVVQMAVLERATLFDLENSVADDPNNWRTQYWFGKRAAESGDFARAEPALRAAFGTASDFLPAATDLGRVLLAQGKVEEAYQVLRMVVGRDPNQTDALFTLAQLYRGQQSYARAMEILNPLLEKDPGNVPALYELSVCQIGTQQVGAAEQSLRKAYAKDANNVMVLTALSRINREGDKLAEAETLARRAVELQPADPLTRLELARTLAEQQPAVAKRREALEELRKALEVSPGHVPVLQEAGRLLIEDGRFSEAIAALTTVIRVQPQNTRAHFQLAEAFRRSKRPDDARRAEAAFKRYQSFDQRLQAAYSELSERPDSAEVRFRIGELQAEMGDAIGAIRSYRAGLQREPENAKARARLAVLMRQNVERQGASQSAP